MSMAKGGEFLLLPDDAEEYAETVKLETVGERVATCVYQFDATCCSVTMG